MMISGYRVGAGHLEKIWELEVRGLGVWLKPKDKCCAEPLSPLRFWLGQLDAAAALHQDRKCRGRFWGEKITH